MNKWQASDFWQYSLAVYANELVKDTCLTLQNDYGLNVNVVLLCGFVASHGYQFPGQQALSCLLSAIADSDDKLQRHRAKRNRVARQSEQYRVLLEQELALEKIQQQALVAALNTIALQAGGMPATLTQYIRLAGLDEEPRAVHLIQQLDSTLQQLNKEAPLR